MLVLPVVRLFAPKTTDDPAVPLREKIVWDNAMPEISKVAPLLGKLTAVALFKDPVTANVPPLIVVVQVYWFVPARVIVPEPVLVRDPPVPEMTPA